MQRMPVGRCSIDIRPVPVSIRVSRLRLLLSRLLHRWLRVRGVGRRLMQQRIAVRGVGVAASASDEARLRRAAGLSVDRLLAELHARSGGLSEREAAVRLRRWGPNELPREPAWQLWVHRWQSVASPFNLLLMLLAALAWFADDARAATVIGVDRKSTRLNSSHT